VPTRVGDTWTFTVPRTEVPANATVTADLGQVVADEDYHATLTCRVTWDDPVGTPFQRGMGLQIGLVAYDASGNQLLSWDSGLILSQDRQYMTDGTATRNDVSLVAQGVVHPPAVDFDNFKLEMQYPTGDVTDPIVVEEATVILSIITPR
jgi:hypothetical protein